MRLVLSDDTLTAVARRIREFSGLHADTARRFDALPLYADMGATVLLRADGELVALSHATGEPTTVEEPWITIALVAGAEKYPEFQCLVPRRPADVTDCGACAGTGRVSVESFEFRCGTCHSLGWLPVRA